MGSGEENLATKEDMEAQLVQLKQTERDKVMNDDSRPLLLDFVYRLLDSCS